MPMYLFTVGDHSTRGHQRAEEEDGVTVTTRLLDNKTETSSPNMGRRYSPQSGSEGWYMLLLS